MFNVQCSVPCSLLCLLLLLHPGLSLDAVQIGIGVTIAMSTNLNDTASIFLRMKRCNAIANY